MPHQWRIGALRVTGKLGSKSRRLRLSRIIMTTDLFAPELADPDAEPITWYQPSDARLGPRPERFGHCICCRGSVFWSERSGRSYGW
jgi:hypothetical protein